jgi:hypothetical protein
MINSRRRIAAAAITTLALALAGAQGVPAEAAPAATVIFKKYKVLNGGKQLAATFGTAVTAAANDQDSFQHWQRISAFGVPAQSGFSTPFQLKNRATGLCLRDTGLNQVVAERVCEVAPTATSRQLWHNHLAVDRTVNNEVYRFRYNRATGRVLAQAPQFGIQVPVVAQTQASNVGSAAAALQLWEQENVAIGTASAGTIDPPRSDRGHR